MKVLAVLVQIAGFEPAGWATSTLTKAGIISTIHPLIVTAIETVWTAIFGTAIVI